MNETPMKPEALEAHTGLLAACHTLKRSKHVVCHLLASFAAEEHHKQFGYAGVLDYAVTELELEPREAKELLLLGKRLRRLPLIDQAFADGRLAYSKARELARVVVPSTQEAWLERAGELNCGELQAHVAATLPGGEPPDDEALLQRPTRQRLFIEGTADEVRLIQAALVAARAAAGSPTKDEVSDASFLADIARRALHDMDSTTAPTSSPWVTVIQEFPDGTQRGRDTHVGLTALSQAEESGPRIDLRPGPKQGHIARAIPPATKRHVRHRDGERCTVPGCSYHLWIDVHHIHPRHLGGDHSPGNLLTLCSAHHKMSHDGLLAIHPRGPGRVAFGFATGEVYEVRLGQGVRVSGHSQPRRRLP